MPAWDLGSQTLQQPTHSNRHTGIGCLPAVAWGRSRCWAGFITNIN
jgi:hypothetical protein